MTVIINPGSRVPTDVDNTYEQALTEARRWHNQIRSEGFGDDLNLVEPDPADCRDGRWTFTFEHRVTGVTAELETHGLDTTKHPLVRQYWRGSSSGSPALSDWSAPGYVQTFRPADHTRCEAAAFSTPASRGVRMTERHGFCCGEGEQFIQRAEALLWEHVQTDDDAAAEAASSMLTALLPAVLGYGNQRAAEAVERVAAVVHRVHVDLGPEADLWAVANGIERDAAALRAEAAS